MPPGAGGAAGARCPARGGFGRVLWDVYTRLTCSRSTARALSRQRPSSVEEAKQAQIAVPQHAAAAASEH